MSFDAARKCVTKIKRQNEKLVDNFKGLIGRREVDQRNVQAIDSEKGEDVINSKFKDKNK